MRRRILNAGEELHAPYLIDIQVLHVLRRYNRTREMSNQRAEEAISDYLALVIERHSHEVVFARVWELRSSLTAYDAAYVALAELIGTPLVTVDRRLAKAAPRVAELRAGKPVARLVAWHRHSVTRKPGRMRGRIRVGRNFDAPLPAGLF